MLQPSVTFWVDWSNTQRFIFISFWNNIRALANSEDDVVELLQYILSGHFMVPLS